MAELIKPVRRGKHFRPACRPKATFTSTSGATIAVLGELFDNFHQRCQAQESKP